MIVEKLQVYPVLSTEVTHGIIFAGLDDLKGRLVVAHDMKRETYTLRSV